MMGAAMKKKAEAPKRTTVRILHISDTHSLLTEEVIRKLPAADILIHTGDFTESGNLKEVQEFNKLLSGPLKAKYPHRVVVAGNHDLYHVGNNYKVLKDTLTGATHFLVHEQMVRVR